MVFPEAPSRGSLLPPSSSFPSGIPPLRDAVRTFRLAFHFLASQRGTGKKSNRVFRGAMNALVNNDWPGTCGNLEIRYRACFDNHPRRTCRYHRKFGPLDLDVGENQRRVEGAEKVAREKSVEDIE